MDDQDGLPDGTGTACPVCRRERQCAPTLTAGRGGCVVPNSQIDMVVRGDEDDRDRWFVCGDIAPGPGNAARPIGLHVVVRQGDVIARGHATRDFGRWRFEVVPDGDGQLTVGWAIASAVAIVEKENPPGLETLTWVQRVEVMEERGTDQPFEFPRRRADRDQAGGGPERPRRL